jgi:hypothetical protein
LTTASVAVRHCNLSEFGSNAAPSCGTLLFLQSLRVINDDIGGSTPDKGGI